MAEDFQAAICSDNWWSSSRSMLVAVGGLSPCSAGIGDLSWPPADDFPDIKPKSATDSDHNSNNSMLFQDYSTLQMMGLALSSSTTTNHWNQSDDFLGGGGRGESNFDSNGFESYNNQQIRNPTNFSSDSSSINGLLKQGDNQDYNMLEQNRLNSINCSSTSSTPSCQGLFPLDSTLYGYPSTKLLQSLYNDSDPHQQPPHGHSIFNTSPSINTNSTFPTNPNDLSLSSTDPNFASNYIKPSLPQPQPQPGLLFPNNAPFWNASAVASSTDIASLFEENNPKSQISSLALKPNNIGNCGDGEESKKGDKNSPTTESVPFFKRPRIETPSPLPTFKVRKEKLGDRVTALQQLVSPFGKTDTASVLHEAIEYIKFLHDQVSVLSTPYMKSDNGITPIQHQQVCEKADPDCPKQDLRSRGLCLVPISSTFPVTNAATAGDFWTPTFGGTFR